MQITRLAHITSIFVEEGLGFLTRRGDLTAVGDGAPAEPAQALSDREMAIRLRRALERLGPTFVKFGQLLATRVDLFSAEFIQELGKLHSSVAPFPHETAVEIIEQELERPLAEVFADFPTKPIASASVAQVYKARLAGSGRVVAVKVQRPNLEASLLKDLEILVQMSGWLDALVPTYRKSALHLVAKEYAHRARTEINFVGEARAIERFQELLQDDGYFRVPEVVPSLTKERLIVMEWLDGTTLDQVATPAALRAAGFEPETFCRELLRLQVCMSYEYGFIHGDTHPGNMILLPDGKVGLIDFGLHGEVSKRVRDKMVEAMAYQSRGDIDRMVDVLVEIAPPRHAATLPEYKKDLKAAMAAEIDPDNLVSEHKISDQLIVGIRIGARYKNRAEPDLMMVVRNLAIVEGIILRYFPTMRPIRELKDIINGIMRRRFSPKALHAQMGQVLPELAAALSRRPETLARLMSLEKRFVEAPDLGAFLRLEGVLRDAPAAPGRPSRAQLIVVALLGAAAGALLLHFAGAIFGITW